MTTQEYFDIEKLKLPERAQQALMVMNVSCAELLQKESFSSYAKYGSKSLDAIRNLLNQIRSLLLENSFDDSLEYIGLDTINGKRKLYFELHKSDLSARAQAILVDLPLSFPQILELSRHDIFAIKHCGNKTANEILLYIDSIKKLYPSDCDSNKDLCDINKHSNFTFDEILRYIPVRALHVIKSFNITNRKELSKFLYEDPKVRNFGEKTRAELITFYENLVFEELSEIDRECRRAEFLNKYNLCSSNALKIALETIYSNILSLIEINKRQRIKTYLQSHSDIFQLDIDNELRKNNIPLDCQLRKSLYAFRELFFEKSEEILSKPSDELAILDDFIYLSESEKIFVLDYKKVHKHLPLYFLMQEAIRHVYINNDYSYDVYADIFNISDPSKKKVDRRLTTYEKKQKINSLLENLQAKYAPLVTNDAYTNIRHNPYLSSRNTYFIQLQKSEQLELDFAAFCLLSSVLFPEIRVINIQFYNSTYSEAPICGYQVPSPIYTYAVNQLLLNYKYAETITDIWTLCNKKHILENIEINLYPKYLLNIEMWKQSTIEYPILNQISELLQLMLDDVLGGVKVVNGILYIRANCIDKKRFLYEYIATHKRPVSISEVMQVFNARHPEWAFESANQVRYYLSDKALFKSIGKTSLYVLKESAMFTGNIMDAIRQVMQSLNNPTNIEIIISRVLKLRPDSTHKSVRTNIKQMVKNGEIVISENNLRLLK